jgi:hypothetical protein
VERREPGGGYAQPIRVDVQPTIITLLGLLVLAGALGSTSLSIPKDHEPTLFEKVLHVRRFLQLSEMLAAVPDILMSY